MDEQEKRRILKEIHGVHVDDYDKSWNAFVETVLELQRETEYYKAALEESKEVIRQLAEGVGVFEYEYIHPADLHELFNTGKEALDVYVFERGAKSLVVLPSGKRYRRSVFMPRKMKDIE